MNTRSIRYWKDEAERLYRAGDMRGFAEAEKMIEAWRLAESFGIKVCDGEHQEKPDEI